MLKWNRNTQMIEGPKGWQNRTWPPEFVQKWQTKYVNGKIKIGAATDEEHEQYVAELNIAMEDKNG